MRRSGTTPKRAYLSLELVLYTAPSLPHRGRREGAGRGLVVVEPPQVAQRIQMVVQQIVKQTRREPSVLDAVQNQHAARGGDHYDLFLGDVDLHRNLLATPKCSG